MDPITIALGLAQFAPTILRFFGVGDKGVAVAEKVVGVAQTITGARTPEEALELMKQNAEAQVAFQQKMVEIDADLERAYLADRADARKRDSVFIEHGLSNTRGNVLAYIAIGSLVSLVFLLFFTKTELQPAIEKLLFLIIGSLISIVKDVYAFEFGSTRDSQNKTKLLADMGKTK